MKRYLPFALPALLLAAGCGLDTGLPDGVSVGVISAAALHTPALAVPDTVAVNETFNAVVTTLGYGSCWQASNTVVDLRADSVAMVPYDENRGGTCTAVLVELSRNVPLHFTKAGRATVVLRGRAETELGYAPTEVSATVVVR
jgi:hypothetical protein